MRVFCIANQKGGVGKTTTAVSLAAALAKTGAGTLLADFDPQCNATSGIGMQPSSQSLFTLPPLSELVPPQPVTTNIPHLDILPGCRNVAELEALSRCDETAMQQIQQQLRQTIGEYDYVLLDCPPSLGQLTQLALSVSTEIIMPIQCEFFAMEGLVQMIEVIKNIMQRRKSLAATSQACADNDLQFAGIALTMYDAGLELTHEVENEVREFFGEIVFETVIPRDVAVSEAPGHALSILDYAPRSRGARAYTELCMELLL
jgi:chromosome partitioning protein